MKKYRINCCLAAALCLLLALSGCSLSSGSSESSGFKPTVNQAGKDVVWVPTPQKLVDKMLDMAKVTSSDYVIDLGSGDGRLVITAAKRGATALGVEYNPNMVKLAQSEAEKAGMSKNAKFEEGDLFEKDFSQATVITMYLLPRINLQLRPKILDMKPGTRVVSHAFNMSDWEPDQVFTVEDDVHTYNGYMWIVPAKVDGVWKLDNGQLALSQTFQKVSGAMTVMGKETPLTGSLDGDKITLEVGGAKYTGTVSGNTITGALDGGAAWKASR